MKPLAFMLSIGSICLFTGCGKDDDSGSQPLSPQPALTAQVNGSNWVSATTNYALSNTEVQFSGKNANGDIIELFMSQVNGPVTYSSTHPGTYILARYQTQAGAEWKSNMPGGEATISVTDFDQNTKLGSGTFSFTAPAANSAATGEKTVTNGTFTEIKLSF